jgi:hypothetical protein
MVNFRLTFPIKCYRLKIPGKELVRPVHDVAFFIPMILALFLAGDDRKEQNHSFAQIGLWLPLPTRSSSI